MLEPDWLKSTWNIYRSAYVGPFITYLINKWWIPFTSLEALLELADDERPWILLIPVELDVSAGCKSN